MKPSPEVLAAAHDHAAAEAPRECCGLVIDRAGLQEYVACRNIAPEGAQFVLHPEDYAAAADAGRIVAIVHSHVNTPVTPSWPDCIGCEKSGLPWIVVQYPHRIYQQITPQGWRAPLEGRPFLLGVLDCYALIRDYYAERVGVDLPDFDRTPGWEKRGEDLYLRHFPEAGFADVTGGDIDLAISRLEKHDVILMTLGEPCTNHGAVYVGDDVILHHLTNQLSKRAPYGGYFRKATTRVLRYAGAVIPKGAA